MRKIWPTDRTADNNILRRFDPDCHVGLLSAGLYIVCKVCNRLELLQIAYFKASKGTLKNLSLLCYKVVGIEKKTKLIRFLLNVLLDSDNYQTIYQCLFLKESNNSSLILADSLDQIRSKVDCNVGDINIRSFSKIIQLYLMMTSGHLNPLLLFVADK